MYCWPSITVAGSRYQSPRAQAAKNASLLVSHTLDGDPRCVPRLSATTILCSPVVRQFVVVNKF